MNVQEKKTIYTAKSMGRFENMDDYDIAVLRNALKLIENVRDTYYGVYSNRLYRRLDTVCRKIQKILDDCAGENRRNNE